MRPRGPTIWPLLRIRSRPRKKILIVGFGRIGTRVAKRCLGFEMDVLVSDPYIDQKLITDAGCTPVADFKSVLPEIDYLTMHTPLTDETRAVINADAAGSSTSRRWSTR